MSKEITDKFVILQDYISYGGACGGFLFQYGDDEEDMVKKVLEDIKEFIIDMIGEAGEFGNALEEETEFLNKYYDIISRGKSALKIEELLKLSMSNDDIYYKILLVGKGAKGCYDILTYLLNDINNGKDYNEIENDWLWSDEEVRQDFRNRIFDLLSRLNNMDKKFYKDLDCVVPYID